MLKIATTVIALSVLSGCTLYNNRAMPVEVSIIPNDCANESAIIRWLESMERQEKGMLIDGGVYAQEQRAIKHKKWQIKYICNAAG
jgi:hypothetical protein